MWLLTSQIKDTAGMEGQIFADQKLCLTSCILMGLYSNLDNVTIFALFLTRIMQWNDSQDYKSSSVDIDCL